jgi:hypothetical protein
MRELLRLRAQLVEGLGRCLSERRVLAERILTGRALAALRGCGGCSRTRSAAALAVRPNPAPPLLHDPHLPHSP